MKKRIVCLTLAILMCGSQAVSVMADRESDLREEQAWTSQQLDATYARMSALWDQNDVYKRQVHSWSAPGSSEHPCEIKRRCYICKCNCIYNPGCDYLQCSSSGSY